MSERQDLPTGQSRSDDPRPNGATPTQDAATTLPRPPERTPATKPHNRRWMLLGAVLVLLVIGVVVALVARGSDEDSADTAKHTVTYKVTGGPAADLTYSTDKTGTISQLGGITLPWTKTVDITGRTAGLRVSARNNGAGTVTCTIDVDGKVVQSTRTEGKNASASCIAP